MTSWMPCQLLVHVRTPRDPSTGAHRTVIPAFPRVTALTSGWWTVAIGTSLVCDPSIAPSDAIIVENFDPDYLLFERARQLRRAGLAPRVLVPVWTDRGTREPNDVALGTAEVMARVSRIGPTEIVPVHEEEPITLNAARDVQRFLEREHIRSVIVVTPL